jgi:protein-S-isoprenylcysteine O-methyltransferase Ste14
VIFLGWLAAIVLFLQLPIPLYWFVLHPQVHFWRRHQKAGFIVALLLSWPPITFCIFFFRRELFRRDWPPRWSVSIGLAFVILEAWLFWRLSWDLGAARLVGRNELSGGGSIADHGVYARIRHPRYVGSFFAILGACLLAGKSAMWIVAAIWVVLTLVAIALEERELRGRFGAAYKEYTQRVPRFLPRLRMAARILGRGGDR